MRRSPRLVAAVAAWALGLGHGLCAADGLAPGWRLMLAALAMGLIWPPWRRVLCGRHARSVNHLVWERDGTWTVRLAGGVVERGCLLTRASSAAGPFVWLALRGRVLHRAVLDRRVQEAAGFAALRRRLRVERGALR